MRINGNNWHKKGQSGRAWGYKCVIMVLSNNKKRSSRQAPSGAFLLGGEYADYRERIVVVETICE